MPPAVLLELELEEAGIEGEGSPPSAPPLELELELGELKSLAKKLPLPDGFALLAALEAGSLPDTLRDFPASFLLEALLELELELELEAALADLLPSFRFCAFLLSLLVSVLNLPVGFMSNR